MSAVIVNPFSPPTPPVLTQQQKLDRTILTIQTAYRQVANAMASSYATILTHILANPYGLTKDEVNAFLGADLVTTLGADASILKAVINHKSPGLITDALPEATITLPGA